MISVLPRLSWVMSRRAATFTRSLSRPIDRGCGCGYLGFDGGGTDGGGGNGFFLPGIGKGRGTGRVGFPWIAAAICASGDRQMGQLSWYVLWLSIPIAYTSTSVSRIICFNDGTSMLLLVSLPSEMTSTAFLRCVPACASGTASATASNSA